MNWPIVVLCLLEVFLLDINCVISAEEPLPYLTQDDFAEAENVVHSNSGTPKSWTREGKPKNTKRHKFRSSVVRPSAMWPSGRIPYEISREYTRTERALLAKAVKAYQDRTCVKYVPRTPSDYDYVYIGKVDKEGCWSDGVGRVGGRQEVSLPDDCLDYPSVLHELMHAAGFFHEHERIDRDQFITVLYQNIEPENRDQFTLDDPSEASTYQQPYDYMSIMHYDSTAFSSNGQQTMVAKQPGYTPIMGTGQDFTPTDLRKISILYKCANGIPQPAVNQPVVPTQPTWTWQQTPQPNIIINPFIPQPQVGQPVWPFTTNNQVTNVQQGGTSRCLDKDPANCQLSRNLCNDRNWQALMAAQCATTCNSNRMCYNNGAGGFVNTFQQFFQFGKK